jgi:hypothetical protein
MKSRRVPSLLLAALLASSASAFAQTIPAPRLNAEQKLRAQALSKLVDDVFTQKYSAPADVALTWSGVYLAAGKGLVYVPYTINIDGKFTGMPVAMYVRVLTKDARPASLDTSKMTTLRSYTNQMNMVIDIKDFRDGHIPATGVVTQDVHFFEPPRDGRLSRGIWLPPGEYNMFIAMREKGKGAELPRTAVIQQELTVPDLSSGLALSSVILVSSLEPAPASSKKQNQLDDPYSLGGTRMIPAPSTRLPRAGEMTAVFFIYNPTAATSGKPDLLVEYMFYQRAGEKGLIGFKSSAPQIFDATTLPATFDLAANQQIMGGLAVPLSSFPGGEYRLEVKVTDKAGQATTTRVLDFSVFGN